MFSNVLNINFKIIIQHDNSHFFHLYLEKNGKFSYVPQDVILFCSDRLT